MCYLPSQSQPGWSRAKSKGNYLKSSLTASHCFWIPLWLRTPLSFETLQIPTCYRKVPFPLALTQHHNSLKTWLLHSPKPSFSAILNLNFQGQFQLQSDVALTVPSHRETRIQRLILEFLGTPRQKLNTIKHLALDQWASSASKRAYCPYGWTQFHPRSPRARKRETTPISFPSTSIKAIWNTKALNKIYLLY